MPDPEPRQSVAEVPPLRFKGGPHGASLIGRRVTARTIYSKRSKPGDYAGPIEDDPRAKRGSPVWYIRDPNGTIGALSAHTVTEHEDRTITVEPSIDGGGWHGWLRRGVWTDV